MFAIHWIDYRIILDTGRNYAVERGIACSHLIREHQEIENSVPVGVLTLHLHLPGCSSLKEKRSRIKPLLARLQREFNISVAEMGHQDVWGQTILVCAMVSNDHGYTQRALQNVCRWIERHWQDVQLVEEEIELIP